MTREELKEQAKLMGYTIAKKPCYQCSCYVSYPNECLKRKNGKWKCVDEYKPIKFERKGWHAPITKCARVEPQESEEISDRNMKMWEEIFKAESDHKCHTCKHYISGEHDGSCGSYICKGYSNWESEDKEQEE